MVLVDRCSLRFVSVRHSGNEDAPIALVVRHVVSNVVSRYFGFIHLPTHWFGMVSGCGQLLCTFVQRCLKTVARQKNALVNCLSLFVERYAGFPYETIQSCRKMHAMLVLVMHPRKAALVSPEYLLEMKKGIGLLYWF